MQILFWILTGVLAYLLGSIPFGFLIAKSRGVDVRTVGSKNIGATNVFRTVGKGPGIATFALDMGKGFCAAFFLPRLLAFAFWGIHGWNATGFEPLNLFAGACAIIGHNWTCFLGFKGGKGIATSAGLLLGLSPLGVLIALVAWVVTFVTTRYVSVASIIAAIVLGGAVWPLHLGKEGAWFAAALTLLALVAIWKHRSNIARLRAGTESQFSFGKKKG